MTSPDNAWVTCSVSGATPLDGHVYQYGTTDGGKTWTKLLGAP
jgi:hypothetical protein